MAEFSDYFEKQIGRGIYEGPLWQDGGAIRGYAGKDYQYGSGLGSFGRTLMRWAVPILKYLGSEGLQAGVNVGNDILAGQDVKDSIKRRAKESGTKIAADAVGAVTKKLRGSGMARKRRRKMPRRINKKSRGVKKRRTVRRRRTRRRARKNLTDIFT